MHEVVQQWEVKPTPDPEVRKISTTLPNPDAWDPKKLEAEQNKLGEAEIANMRSRYMQQQAQRRFKEEVRAGFGYYFSRWCTWDTESIP
jgi:hypothetical protein